MGNSTAKKESEEKFDSSHPNFKDAKVVTINGNKHIEAYFKSQSQEYDEWKVKVKEGGNKPSSNYLLLPENHSYKSDTGLCGNTGTVTSQYPYNPYLLSELISQRQSEHQLFKESELWYVLYSLTAAKLDIRQHSNKLGDIKPGNVFVDEEGKIKVANVYSWPRQLPSYCKAIDFGAAGYDGLLAPEDFFLLKSNHLDNEGNHQSEVFAIGATILSAGILENLDSVYNYKGRQINLEALKEKKRLWGESDKYSPIFKSIILNLVSVDPNNRLTIDQLWSFILPFQQDILQKKQFVIPGAPPKIEQSFAALRSKVY